MEVRQLVEAHGGGLAVRLIDDLGAEGAAGPTAGGARAALLHARASIVASGTATVEAALMGNPFVVVYRVSALTYAIAKRVVKVDHVAMVNLIAGKRIVPELIQSEFTAEKIVREMKRLIAEGEPRQAMIEDLKRVREVLTPISQLPKCEGAGAPVPVGAIDRVAAITLEFADLSD
jgi:lipid-A-disaccharide synthase